MTEFIIAFGLGFFMILGTIQMGLVYNAHSILKLAAFNAARAAIVERPENVEKPVTVDEMKSTAKLEAWFTILPVIPWIQGRIDPSGNLALKMQVLHQAAAATPTNSIARQLALRGLLLALGGNFAARAERISDEFGELTVTIHPAEKALKSFDLFTDSFKPGSQALEFDDRVNNRSALVRVVVRWDYPLLIPFVDRVIFVASGQGSTAGNKPAWAVGTHLYKTQGNEPFRIPLFASYVMRMQWDATSS